MHHQWHQLINMMNLMMVKYSNRNFNKWKNQSPIKSYEIFTLRSQVFDWKDVFGWVCLVLFVHVNQRWAQDRARSCPIGKQEFRRTDFGSRLLAAEGEGGKGQWGWGHPLKWSNILLVVARSPRLKSLRQNSCYPSYCYVIFSLLLFDSIDRLSLYLTLAMNCRYHYWTDKQG
jgi:hypothetical protein